MIKLILLHSIHLRRKLKSRSYHTYEEKITRATTVKFTGVLLDAHLSWKSHITKPSKKLASTVGIFYKIRHLFPLETLKILFFSQLQNSICNFCNFFVTYGIAVWGLTHKSLLDPIIVSQKKIITLICFRDPTAHAEHLFKELNLLKIHKIHELQILSFVYDCQNNIACFHSYFTPSSNVHSFNTRQASRGDLFLTRKTTF